MMKTMTVVSHVSFQVGHVTFSIAFAPDFAEELNDPVRLYRRRSGQVFARAVRSLFRRLGHAVNPFLCHLAGVEGLEPTAYGFGDRRSTN